MYCGVHSTLDTVNMECMLWSLQYTGYSEYPMYCRLHQYTLYSLYPVYCGVHSTLDTVNTECMLVESTVHWIQ